jgi:hypothetical protein
MANSISLAERFYPILDEIYKRESLTSFLDAPTKPISHAGAAEVNIFKTAMTGLGDYSRATGYPAGDVTGTWETITLEADRGRSFAIDAMDDEESLGMAFGTLVGEFMRTQVVPEVDAYRFARYASWSGIQTTSGATLSDYAGVIAAIDVASLAMDEAEVPPEGRVLFISSTHWRLLSGGLTRTLDAVVSKVDRRLRVLDELEIIPVPQSRFYTALTLATGATSDSGGYAKAGTGKNINFMMLHPTAVDQATKHAPLKVFTPQENQTADAWMVQYRLYHDCWVYDNKVDGVYLHKVA